MPGTLVKRQSSQNLPMLHKRQSSQSLMIYAIDDVIKHGYVRIRGKNLGFWTRRYVVFRKTSSQGPCRLDKYPDEKFFAAGEKPIKSIHISDISSIERVNSNEGPIIGLNFFNSQSSRLLECNSDTDLEDWFQIFSKEVACSKSENELKKNSSAEDLDEIKEGDVMYPVNLLPHASTAVNGECFLQVTDETVSLFDAETAPKLKLLQWPLTCIQRYGKDSSKFTLEVGQQCLTGAGTFIFMTSKASDIYARLRVTARGKISQQKEISRRTKERNMRKIPRVPSKSQLRKSFTEGCLIFPGQIYDEAFIQGLDEQDGLSSPEGSPKETGTTFILGSC